MPLAVTADGVPAAPLGTSQSGRTTIPGRADNEKHSIGNAHVKDRGAPGNGPA